MDFFIPWDEGCASTSIYSFFAALVQKFHFEINMNSVLLLLRVDFLKHEIQYYLYFLPVPVFCMSHDTHPLLSSNIVSILKIGPNKEMSEVFSF